jgi:hypothetical protein
MWMPPAATAIRYAHVNDRRGGSATLVHTERQDQRDDLTGECAFYDKTPSVIEDRQPPITPSRMVSDHVFDHEAGQIGGCRVVGKFFALRIKGPIGLNPEKIAWHVGLPRTDLNYRFAEAVPTVSAKIIARDRASTDVLS